MNICVKMKTSTDKKTVDVLNYLEISKYMNAEEPSLLDLLLYYRSAIFHSLKGDGAAITMSNWRSLLLKPAIDRTLVHLCIELKIIKVSADVD
jgi:hypothetical protein